MVSSGTTYVQVFGRVAVHDGGHASRLSGSGMKLLGVLVASGPDGASAERIAEEIWGDHQPNPWRPALRMAVTRLRKRLPAGWDIISERGAYRITTGSGWIDAWRLETMAASTTPIEERDLHWSLAGTPFADFDLVGSVDTSARNLEVLQVAVVERFCSQGAADVSTETCSLLVRIMQEHPYNDRLAVEIASTLGTAGRRNEALVALRAFAQTYVEDFGTLPADVERFLSANEGILPLVPAPLPQPDTVVLPRQLQHLVESPLLGRAAELEALRTANAALLCGPRGAGKTRLIAEVIRSNSQRGAVYVVGDDEIDLPLGPFAAAMPELRSELLAIADDLGEDATSEGSALPAAYARAWRLVLGYLEQRAANRSQLLVVDDAHLLDAVSRGLLRLLIRSKTVSDIAFLVCGSNDVEDPDWLEVVREAERAGFDAVSLAGLAVGEIEHLVHDQFPHAVVRLRRGLASDVHRVTEGLPAAVLPLIQAADPQTLALPDQIDGLPALAAITGSVAERTAEVLTAAAILGSPFSIGGLISLVEFDEPDVFRALDEMWKTGLIQESDDPDRLRFSHVLVQRALVEGAPKFSRSHLHQRAAGLTDDAHERADHLVHAGGLVDAHQLGEALLGSAHLYAENRQWRDVAREMARLQQHCSQVLDASGYTLWATALDKSGSDGVAHRRTAYELASAEHDWSTALDAALSGLPEAERPDGDPERLAMIENITPSALSRSERFRRASALCRQYSYLADGEEKLVRYANEALAIAATPDEVGHAHVMRWSASRHHHRLERIAFPANLEPPESLDVRARIAQVVATDLAEAGQFDAARTAADRFQALALEQADPFRMWHAQAFGGLFLLLDGDFEGADEVARANMTFAELHDLQQGLAAYLGHRVFSFECQGRLAELHEQLHPFRANLASILLGRTALALCAHAVGDDLAASEIRSIVEQATRMQGGTMALLALMFLAEHITELTPDLAPAAREILEAYGETPVLAAFAGVSFAPAVRYVAQLHTDHDERAAANERAIEVADQHGTLLWRVRTRLDAVEHGDTVRGEQATEIAAGTGLEDVVARYLSATTR